MEWSDPYTQQCLTMVERIRTQALTLEISDNYQLALILICDTSLANKKRLIKKDQLQILVILNKICLQEDLYI